MTFVLVAMIFGLSVFVTSIASVITVVGATSNTAVGFCLPMIFYLKFDSEVNEGRWSIKKVTAHLINLLFIGFSVASLTIFFKTKF